MNNKKLPIIITLIFISVIVFCSIYFLLANEKVNKNIDTSVNSTQDTFTFAWMSDTQYYSESYPEILDTNIHYILDNKTKDNIKYVIHTGDIVDDMKQSYQWKNVNNSLSLLDDSNMPYGILAGNHDVNEDQQDYSKYYENYGASRFNSKSFYGESYKNNKGHYDLISISGNDFIIVYMGYGVGNEEYSWMNKVLQENKNKKAILCFHNYLNIDGNIDECGKEIFDNVVLKNSNVFMVLNGHYHGVSRKIDEIDDNNDGMADRKVYQILSDYQYGEYGGNGYMRFIEFSPKDDMINFKTYSPKLNDYNFYDNNEIENDEYGYKDEFSIPFDLK